MLDQVRQMLPTIHLGHGYGHWKWLLLSKVKAYG